jgi:hypothetical protein
MQVSKSITWELCNGTSNSDFIHLIGNLLWMSLSEILQMERILVLVGGGGSLLFVLNQNKITTLQTQPASSTFVI